MHSNLYSYNISAISYHLRNCITLVNAEHVQRACNTLVHNYRSHKYILLITNMTSCSCWTHICTIKCELILNIHSLMAKLNVTNSWRRTWNKLINKYSLALLEYVTNTHQHNIYATKHTNDTNINGYIKRKMAFKCVIDNDVIMSIWNEIE